MKRHPTLKRVHLFFFFFLIGPCLTFSQNTQEVEAESATAVAGPQYAKSKFNQWVFGKNYRSTWATAIHNIPVLDVENFDGGLVPYEKGGSGETLSLKFKSAKGRRYAFRL
ncbi:MAG: hypothetical protein AAF985_26560, partial [Bacteroidota bacterium]